VGLKDELVRDVDGIFRYAWPATAARIVPQPGDIPLGDSAKELEQAVVLYADLDGSTVMVDSMPWWFCAQVYKSFLQCAAKIIRFEGGVITAYDGDRIMAIFIAPDGCDRAVRTAHKLYWIVANVINQTIAAKYPSSSFRVRHSVGIDSSRLHAVRTGIRGDNDIVWVGSAANHAAKLTTLGADPPTWITKPVYEALNDRFRTSSDCAIWEPRLWTQRENQLIYCSNCWLTL
jgi:class 3 adenylate cyclase